MGIYKKNIIADIQKAINSNDYIIRNYNDFSEFTKIRISDIVVSLEEFGGKRDYILKLKDDSDMSIYKNSPISKFLKKDYIHDVKSQLGGTPYYQLIYKVTDSAGNLHEMVALVRILDEVNAALEKTDEIIELSEKYGDITINDAEYSVLKLYDKADRFKYMTFNMFGTTKNYDDIIIDEAPDKDDGPFESEDQENEFNEVSLF